MIEGLPHWWSRDYDDAAERQLDRGDLATGGGEEGGGGKEDESGIISR